MRATMAKRDRPYFFSASHFPVVFVVLVLLLVLPADRREAAVHGLTVRTSPPAADLTVVRRLLGQAKDVPTTAELKNGDDEEFDIDHITAKSAFCNAVYRVTISNSNILKHSDNKLSLIAKVFSPLAATRMRWSDHAALFRIDQLAAENNLGPRIYATTAGDNDHSPTPALLMQDCCEGRALTEQDLRQDADVAQLAARALARLHRLPSMTSDIAAVTSGPPNMLWHGCDVLLEQYAHPRWTTRDETTQWTYHDVRDCIQRHREQLEKQKVHDSLLVTPTGHGDCKPSNLMLLHPVESNSGVRTPIIYFLDLELAGTHYVAFDLAKLWRSDLPWTAQTRDMHRLFLETYVDAYGNPNVTVSSLEQQIEAIMPLTWLEAAAFFAAMSCSSSKTAAERQHWDSLALQRLKSYEQCLSGCR